MQPWLTATLAITGTATGVSGLVLSILNYRRDRARLAFRIDFNQQVDKDFDFSAVVTIVNAGRRPIHASRVGVCPTRWWRVGSRIDRAFMFSLMPGHASYTLEEGSEPWNITVKQGRSDFAKVTTGAGFVRVFATVGACVVQSQPIKIPKDLKR